jgi:hypothetical protein
MMRIKEKPQNPDQEIVVYFSEKINRNPPIAAIYARLNIDHKFNVNLRTIVGNCWDYCSEKGWRVQYIFVDLPERTGKKHKLNVECMKQRVKMGDFDVVVFYKFPQIDSNFLSYSKTCVRTD